MLRLSSVQVESLCYDVLPDEVHALPGALAALDELLRDRALLAAIEQRGQRPSRGGWPLCGVGGAADDLDGYVCAVDGGPRTEPAGGTRR
jgi:hypothetical protein